MRKIIKTDQAPQAVGPYSQGVKAGNLLFISGQLGVDPATGEIADESVERQTHQVLRNLQTIAEAAGTSLERALKVTVYLTNMDDFTEMNAVYSRFFPENPPARVCVEVRRLPKGVTIEMDAVCLCK